MWCARSWRSLPLTAKGERNSDQRRIAATKVRMKERTT